MKARQYILLFVLGLLITFSQSGCGVAVRAVNNSLDRVLIETAERLAREAAEEVAARSAREAAEVAARQVALEAAEEAAERALRKGGEVLGEETLQALAKQADEIVVEAVVPPARRALGEELPGMEAILRPFVAGDEVQQLSGVEYRGLARELADPSGKAGEMLAQTVQGKLLQVDELIAGGSADELEAALSELASLRALGGESPELTLREGMILIKQGQLEELGSLLNTGNRLPIADRTGLFEEVLPRLAGDSLDEPAERAPVQQLGSALDWADYHARHNLDGKVSMAVVDGRLLPMYGLEQEMLERTTLEAGERVKQHALYYTEDAPGIYSLEYNVGTVETLGQLVEGELEAVFTLPREDIAHFRPAVIFTGSFDEAVTDVKQSSKINSLLDSSAKEAAEELSESVFTPILQQECLVEEECPEIYLLSRVGED